MEDVVVIAVTGLVLLGAWLMVRDVKGMQRETGGRQHSGQGDVRACDWVIWTPFIVAVVVAGSVMPEFLIYVGLSYLLDWLSDKLWFWYVDWRLKRLGAHDRNRQGSSRRQIAAIPEWGSSR